jgi:preprotein translocase SecF subunit
MFQILVGTKWKFMNKRRVTYVLSVLMIAASLGILIARGGPRESIDFTGGNLLYVRFGHVVQVTDVREAAGRAEMEGAEVQMAENGTQAIIRFRTAEGDTTNQFQNFVRAFQVGAPGDSITLMSQETVGPKIGAELERKAALAILWSLILILAYIAWRFTRISFGIGAVIALFHDILITLGVMTFLGREVSLTVVAAFLTIGGYSINDTIVVFDRIRENRGLARRMSFQEIVDKSINQTLSRTVLTSTTTMLAVGSLFFLGGVVIHDFALAMLVGVVIGTYSSIFVASALALDISNWWVRRKTARQGGGARKTVPAR